MNYELCKKLKDMGFPQKFVDGRKAIVNSDNTAYCFEPTISELIEACGDKFECLYRIVNPDLSTKHWQTHGFDVENLPCGSTPEESVANLWLALNTKEVKI